MKDKCLSELFLKNKEESKQESWGRCVLAQPAAGQGCLTSQRHRALSWLRALLPATAEPAPHQAVTRDSPLVSFPPMIAQTDCLLGLVPVMSALWTVPVVFCTAMVCCPCPGAGRAHQVPLMELASGTAQHSLLLRFFSTFKTWEILIAQRTAPNCFDLHNTSALSASMSPLMPCSITIFIIPAHRQSSFPILSASTPAGAALPQEKEGSESIPWKL